MVINDFSGEGVPVDEFMKANTNRVKGRTFLYAIETKLDRVTRKARGIKEPVVLKFGRSNGLGRLANYWIEFGSAQNSPLLAWRLHNGAPRRRTNKTGRSPR